MVLLLTRNTMLAFWRIRACARDGNGMFGAAMPTLITLQMLCFGPRCYCTLFSDLGKNSHGRWFGDNKRRPLSFPEFVFTRSSVDIQMRHSVKSQRLAGL